MSNSPSSTEDLATNLTVFDLIKNFVEVHDLEIELHDQYVKAVKRHDKSTQLRIERLIRDNRDRYSILAGEAWEFADGLQKDLEEW